MQQEVPHGPSNEVISYRPVRSDEILRKEEFMGENVCRQDTSDGKLWKTIENTLYEKGLEIFGRNRLVT